MGSCTDIEQHQLHRDKLVGLQRNNSQWGRDEGAGGLHAPSQLVREKATKQ